MPVLITPLARNSWRDPTHYNDFLADFADAVLDLGKEEAVPVLDLHAYAMQPIRQEGLETAKRWFYPGDYTHTNDFGAYRMAGFVASALGKAVGLPVADSPAWTPAPPFAPLTPPKDCALPAPDTDPFANYDATRPQEVLTRAEALELAIKALKLFPINVYNDLYADIVGHETYAGTVQCAAQNDLIPAAWIADGRLYPQRTVTAADFLAVLMPGAAGRRPLAAPSPLPDSVPAYARFAAGQAVAEQLISADSLNDPITRSDAAALCRRWSWPKNGVPMSSATVTAQSSRTRSLTPGTTSTRPCASFATTTNGRSSTPTACSRAFCPPTRSLPPKSR